jgi:euchromatic histone-lysine N-methyltransferase
MSESESMDTSTITESPKEDTEDEDMPTKDELNIQQILEGMTNEFNKTSTKRMVESRREINKTELAAARKQEKSQIKITEGNTKPIKLLNCSNHIDEEIKIIKENIPEKKSEKVMKDEISKQESANKKDNIPRIVLTFRTIDENTDHGKKTKISSCASNLSLVPDELVKCDQIGGVSVKIDEIPDEVNKSDNESCKNQKLEKHNNSLNTNKQCNVQQNIENNDIQTKKLPQERIEPISDSDAKDLKNDNTAPDNKHSDELESTVSGTKRNRQKRLRELRFYCIY